MVADLMIPALKTTKRVQIIENRNHKISNVILSSSQLSRPVPFYLVVSHCQLLVSTDCQCLQTWQDRVPLLQVFHNRLSTELVKTTVHPNITCRRPPKWNICIRNLILRMIAIHVARTFKNNRYSSLISSPISEKNRLVLNYRPQKI